MQLELNQRHQLQHMLGHVGIMEALRMRGGEVALTGSSVDVTRKGNENVLIVSFCHSSWTIVNSPVPHQTEPFDRPPSPRVLFDRKPPEEGRYNVEAVGTYQNDTLSIRLTNWMKALPEADVTVGPVFDSVEEYDPESEHHTPWCEEGSELLVAGA